MHRILIIDDQQKVLDIYQRLFTEEGMEVVLAQNASDGIRALIGEQVIDLVLLDINMYGINGGYIKEIIDEYDPQVKVIVSSVHPIDQQIKFIPRAYDYFDKSQGTEILLKQVKRALLLN